MGNILPTGRRFKLPDIIKTNDEAYRIYHHLVINWDGFTVPCIERTITALRKTVAKNRQRIKTAKNKLGNSKRTNTFSAGGEVNLSQDEKRKQRGISQEVGGIGGGYDREDARAKELQRRLTILNKRIGKRK